jgi:hypothetical protein
MASFLLDGLLVALLTATIIYAVILDRRLRTFRQARDEMQALLANFTAATVQAQSGMVSLRDTSQTTAAELKDQFERGKSLRDDLSFLLEHGATLADRLESSISAARASARTVESRGKPAVRLAEAVARPAAEARPVAAPRAETRTEPRLATERAERKAEPAEAARDFLRALKAAR